MKNVLTIALILVSSLFFMVSATGGAAAKMTVNGETCDMFVHDSTTYGGHSDTLEATDSMWIIHKFTPKIGSEYVLQLGSVSGDGSDSVEIGVYIDAYDNNTILRRKLIDTLAVATGQDVVLPFAQTIFGTKYSVVLIGLAGNGGEVILGPVGIFRRFFADMVKSVIW